MKYIKVLFSMLTVVYLAGCNITSQKTETKQANNLISYYESLKLQSAIESSFNKKVLQKKGYPDGYDLTLSRKKKEVVLVIRPYSKKNFNYLKGDLQRNIEDVLKTKNYSDYNVKVKALWNKTNVSERQKQEEKILKEVAEEFKKRHNQKLEVGPGAMFSATDGRVISITLSYTQNDNGNITEITNPSEINNYNKEFFNLVQEKGFNIKQIPVNFTFNKTGKWIKKIAPSIDIGLKEMTELKVTYTTIIDEKHPIIINTSLNSSDPNAKELGEKIEKLVNEFLQYDEINKSYPGPYGINVLSEDNKKIN
ncbi:DUF4030 domain-containing protein [Gottfriedia acidiceleris]|uniref:DUF4030 domain-containing protein n=1 Tax=Gottfriedia acidiceleris TaxID=371036 RepID=UPI00142F6F34|nr:DUF4030 domain-containing protein [Gottfriedia acidiceleris]